MTSIEHFEPVSHDVSKSNEYDNCFYSCILCNVARSNLPTETVDGECLLNYRRDALGDYFRTSDDQLLPTDDSAGSRYTAEAYDVNDQRKVRMRRIRRETIEECLRFLREGFKLVDALLAKSIASGGDPVVDAAAKHLALHISFARRQLERYRAIPDDAPGICRCGSTRHHTLPPWLETQVLRI